MTCPDWPSLADHRDRDAEAERHWEAALEHLEACGACRKSALAAEPTLVFRRLPALEPSQQDVDDIQRDVHAMLRAQPIVRPMRQRSHTGRRFETAGLMRLAAMLAVVTGGMALYGLLGPGELAPGLERHNVAKALPSDASDASYVPAGSLEPRDLEVEIHVLRASKVERGGPMLDDSDLEPELREKLRGILDYEGFQVLAQGDVGAHQDDDRVAELGKGFTASLKTGKVLEGGKVELHELQIEKTSPLKSGPQRVSWFSYANLEFQLDQMMFFTVGPGADSEDALVLAITLRLAAPQRQLSP